MTPLLRDDDLHRIDLPTPGEFVEVKRRLSRGDEVAVQKRLVGDSRMSQGGMLDVAAERVLEAAEFATLDIAIKRWSFAEPVTPENIRALDGESIDAIKEALNELYPVRSEDEKKDSSENGAGPPLDEAAPLVSLAGSL